MHVSNFPSKQNFECVCIIFALFALILSSTSNFLKHAVIFVSTFTRMCLFCNSPIIPSSISIHPICCQICWLSHDYKILLCFLLMLFSSFSVELMTNFLTGCFNNLIFVRFELFQMVSKWTKFCIWSVFTRAGLPQERERNCRKQVLLFHFFYCFHFFSTEKTYKNQKFNWHNLWYRYKKKKHGLKE